MKKKKKKDNLYVYFKDRWALFLFAIIILGFSAMLLKGELKNYLLNKDSKVITGVIINEKNYMGNSPVSHSFTYSYEFFIDKKSFRNDSHDKKSKIGDKVLIEYLPNYPDFNRVIQKTE